MSLRRITLISMIFMSVVLNSILVMTSRLILMRSFVDLENEYTSKNIQRAMNSIDSELNSMYLTSKDYAAWDDTYSFIEDLNQEYITSNLLPETFPSLNLNVIVYLDAQGKVVFSGAYDLENDQPVAVPSDLIDILTDHPLFRITDTTSHVRGFLLLPEGALMMIAHPILTSKDGGPSRGTVVLGRFMAADFEAHISDVTQQHINLGLYEGSPLRLEMQSATPAADQGTTTFIKILGDHSIAGYSTLNDIFGNPILVLRVEMPRDIYNRGEDVVFYFTMGVLVYCVVVILGSVLALDSQVLSRIAHLSKSVKNVRSSANLSDRVQVSGRDEIASLSEDVNNMLQLLEASHHELRYARDELEERVDERTAELAQVNENLQEEFEERIKAQYTLINTYNEIRQIFDSISSILIGVDAGGVVTHWNNVAVETLGLSAEAAIGQNFNSLPINWDWERVSRGISDCRGQQKKIWLDDIRLERPRGGTRTLGFTLTPLSLNEDSPPGCLISGADITARRILEGQLARAQKMQAIGQLAAGVAHEINTPTQFVGSNLRFLRDGLVGVLALLQKLTAMHQAVKNSNSPIAITSEIEKALDASRLDFFQREAPAAIEESLDGIERISHIVSAMRDFSHPGSEVKEMADLNHIVNNALSLSRSQWKDSAKITTTLDPELPFVECLPNELTQVFINLIINAVHAIQDMHREEPDKEGRITVSSRQVVGDIIEVCVSDNAAGIPEEIRDRIFDPFFTTKEIGHGTGQGLALAYNVVVKKHGGLLDFETTLGHGTTFIVQIPRKANA